MPHLRPRRFSIALLPAAVEEAAVEEAAGAVAGGTGVESSVSYETHKNFIGHEL